ncbi:histone deacetylase [Trichothermofontia sichuanensis B231]|uniref:histone deacetylase family protein n=1 Tax=Trichothermofontia sichuanensis TaxID=3045816 RepID=UPI00224720B6|nr:histone deacetylase [Trichothermofontia sichuanensis]UZQ53502.1 histone deacetylase [Trichothermofontia sichuanensis B231]
MFPVIYSDAFLEHQTGRLHPESPDRLVAIVAGLRAAPWAEQIQWQSPTPISDRDLRIIEEIHTRSYLDQLHQLAASGGGLLDSDTVVSPRSYAIAQLAVSAWLDGVDRVLRTGEPAFALVRPPGHHALWDRGMGFCLLANAAIAAYYALQQPDVNRVAILDWDVHHGNGTQAIVEAHPQIAYCSLHQFPCYPGTGRATEQGYYQNVLNIPLPPGSTIADYLPPFEQRAIPFLQAFQPDLVLVSAGYDANHDDPLASLSLRPEDFGGLTRRALQITRRLLFGLEGGYDLDALTASVLATIAACLPLAA